MFIIILSSFIINIVYNISVYLFIKEYIIFANDKSLYKNLNSSLSGFSFRKNSEGEKEVSTDGGSTWENFNSGASLLWTNPNPLSQYSGGTINLDLSNYDAIVISLIYHINSYEENPLIQVIPKGTTTYLLNGYYGMDETRKQYRLITVSDSKIEIGNNNNNYVTIPYEIYGINGQIDYYK